MSGLIESTYELPRAFLEALFPPRPLAEHYIEIRTLPSRAQAFATPGDEDALTELQKFVRRHAGENIYFGVATRAEQAGTLAGGAKHCVESRALWIDLDFKDTPEPEARALLADFPLETSLSSRVAAGCTFTGC